LLVLTNRLSLVNANNGLKKIRHRRQKLLTSC